MLAGDGWEEWTAERACPVGLIITTPAGTIVFSSTAESYRSWHDGEIFLGHDDDTGESDSDSRCSATVIRSGHYEAEVPYGQETCRMLVEIDHAPSNDLMPPHIGMHMIGCAATEARRVPGEGAAPSRRLLQAAHGAGAGAPSVEVLNMSAVTPAVVFVTTNSTRQVLASQVSLDVPAAYTGPSPRYWLIAAPESVAIGASLPPPPPAPAVPSKLDFA
jgi:hypothetical protein